MNFIRPLLHVGLVLIVACDRAPAPSTQSDVKPLQTRIEWSEYASLRKVARNEALTAMSDFQNSITRFLQVPNAEHRQQASEMWLNLHSAVTRLQFFHLPDIEFSGDALLRRRIDPWPIEPGYLDALPEYPASGIINDLTLPMNETSLVAQHQLTADEEVSLGLHALEFLVWQTKPEDFARQTELSVQQKADQLTLDQLSANRRRSALSLITNILNQDIQQLLNRMTALDEGGDPVPDVLLTLRWTTAKLHELLAEADDSESGAESFVHSPFSSFELTEVRILVQLMEQTYLQDSNLQEVFRSRDESSEARFIDAMQQLKTASTELNELNSESRGILADLVQRLTSLLTEGQAPIVSVLSDS